jgi:hypothetical protein
LEKVSFNGFTKTITVNSGVSSVDIASDVYSAWVRWTSRERQFSAAMRYSGFDPIPNGRTGATFFVINGWKFVYDPTTVAVSGVLYSADYDTAYWSASGQPLYPATVAALVNSAVTTQNIVSGVALTEEQTALAVWNMLLNSGLTANTTLTNALIAASIPQVPPIPAEDIATAVWSHEQ